MRLKEVVTPAEPDTIIGYVPTGVEAAVVIVTALEHVPEQGLFVKDAAAPAGSPEAESVMLCGKPETNVRETAVLPDDPCTTETSPLFESE